MTTWSLYRMRLLNSGIVQANVIELLSAATADEYSDARYDDTLKS